MYEQQRAERAELIDRHRSTRDIVRRSGLPTEAGDELGAVPPRLPQMPAYHLTRPNHGGITMVNIGVGPANAKTITDHIAVLRPHAWMMLGDLVSTSSRR